MASVNVSQEISSLSATALPCRLHQKILCQDGLAAGNTAWKTALSWKHHTGDYAGVSVSSVHHGRKHCVAGAWSRVAAGGQRKSCSQWVSSCGVGVVGGYSWVAYELSWLKNCFLLPGRRQALEEECDSSGTQPLRSQEVVACLKAECIVIKITLSFPQWSKVAVSESLVLGC